MIEPYVGNCKKCPDPDPKVKVLECWQSIPWKALSSNPFHHPVILTIDRKPADSRTAGSGGKPPLPSLLPTLLKVAGEYKEWPRLLWAFLSLPLAAAMREEVSDWPPLFITLSGVALPYHHHPTTGPLQHHNTRGTIPAFTHCGDFTPSIVFSCSVIQEDE
jgi:hypothetical protein